MAIIKLGPALATGNVVVLKPLEVTPLTILFLANLINEVGFPPGVVSIVNGYGNTAGTAIAGHPSIAKVAFTGGTPVITLELGGKSPTITFDNANLDQAIKWMAHGMFFNMGQVCIAGSHIYMQEGIYNKFLKGFTQATRGLTKAAGGPFEEGQVMGYTSGKSEGTKGHVGGEREGE
ncbi:ALDH-like protein [Macrolepiota fuliginosa MF-IS2]|uniref:ALDH-like protein n=1 Tax=Macrolepiota fuliginosa MF-IS2 TaxID=1400762 RepID=A0A9P6BV45_9AGAR|nr:ALDH-like protein [Macrolepiota fuliginosa MF-IS2]